MYMLLLCKLASFVEVGMKKLILLILALCCIVSGCSAAEVEPSSSPDSSGMARLSPYSAAASAVSPPAIPLVNAAATISEQYKEKLIKPLSSCGVFLLCTDPVEMQQGSHYEAYVPDESGSLQLLENRLFNNAYTLGSGRYHFNFNWVENDGIKSLTYISEDTNAAFLYLSDAGSKSLFLLKDYLSSDGSTLYSYYPVLLDFSQEKIKDILSGCGLENISKICNAALGSDGKGMLLAQEGGALYYCELDTTTVYSLDELSSEPVKACALTEDKIICWNQSSSISGLGDVGDYHFWYIDLADFQRKEMPQLQVQEDTGPLRLAHLSGFSSTMYNSKMFSGSAYALCTSGDGRIYVLDMENWQLKAISGYTMPASNVTCRGSLDGQRLLLEDIGNNSAYVIDYAGSLLVRLNVQDAESLSWFDSNTVLEQPGDGNYYLYNIGA